MVQQTTFLGASISKFNTTLGWGDTPSTLNCTLVEDRLNGDSFNPPAIGQPCVFKIENWIFQGILEKYSKQGDSGGSPIYNVSLVDPREILAGVQLILNGYTGYSNVPNVLNVYGSLEDGNFGGSKINSTGIPWYLIRNSVIEMTDNIFKSGESYGGSIQFQGVNYTLDLSDLPTPNDNYRIGSNIISLMEFITDICEITGKSFFFSLTGNIIKLLTVDRNRTPEPGAISTFISSVDGASSKGIGFELRNETTSKMVLGADLHELYGANPYPNNTNYDSIWPFIGFNQDGSATVPYWRKTEREIKKLRKVKDRYDYQEYRNAILDGDLTFNLDSRSVDVPGVGTTYETDIEELYALKESIDSWEYFLDLRNGNKFKPWDYVGKPRIAAIYRIGRKVVGYTKTKILGEEALKEEKLHHLRNQLPWVDVTDKSHFFHEEREYWIYKPKYGPKGVIPVLTEEMQNLLSPKVCMLDFDAFESALKRLKHAKTNNEVDVKIDSKPSNEFLLEDRPVFVGYRHGGVVNPHFMKASLLGISNNQGYKLLQSSVTGDGPMVDVNVLKNSPFDKTHIEKSDKDKRDKDIQRLYDFLSQYSDIGRRFMVSLPFISSVWDSDENEVRTSYENTDGGYLPENEYISALKNGLIPYNPSKFTLQDRRYVAYARFNLKEKQKVYRESAFGTSFMGKKIVDRKLDFSEFNESDVYVDGAYLFIKCTIRPNFVYLNSSTGDSARSIVELPGVVRDGKSPIKQNDEFVGKMILGIIEDDIKKLFTKIGGDASSSPLASGAITPDLIVVPLRNKTASYGPWYAAGANGKVEVEKDETLAPWNYLSYADMDITGNAKVQSAISTQTFDESGDVEFPGIPAILLGGQLIPGGPYITNINVNVGSEGVTTRYSMQTWVPRFGDRLTSAIDRKNKNNQRRLKEQEKLLKAIQLQNINSGYFQQRLLGKQRSKKVKSNSSHHIIAADKDGVVIQPIYNALEQFGVDYEKKAMMSLDGLFAPISFGEQDNELPSVIIPSGMTDGNNALGLLPFRDGTQHEGLVTRGVEPPEEGLSLATPEQDYRTVGLKGPVWIAGWGYDVDGKPVPGQNVSGEILFTDDFNENISGWKAGPLLVGWDEARKGWSASSNTSRIVKIKEMGTTRERFFSSGEIFPHIVRGEIYDMVLPSGNALDEEVKLEKRDGENVNIVNFRDNLLVKDAYYLANIIDGKYVIDNQSEWREFV